MKLYNQTSTQSKGNVKFYIKMKVNSSISPTINIMEHQRLKRTRGKMRTYKNEREGKDLNWNSVKVSWRSEETGSIKGRSE